MTLMDRVRLNKAVLRRPELRLGSIGRHLPALPRQILQNYALCKAMVVVYVRDVDRSGDVNVSWVGRRRHSTP